jgi:hypothetical protein
VAKLPALSREGLTLKRAVGYIALAGAVVTLLAILVQELLTTRFP